MANAQERLSSEPEIVNPRQEREAQERHQLRQRARSAVSDILEALRQESIQVKAKEQFDCAMLLAEGFYRLAERGIPPAGVGETSVTRELSENIVKVLGLEDNISVKDLLTNAKKRGEAQQIFLSGTADLESVLSEPSDFPNSNVPVRVKNEYMNTHRDPSTNQKMTREEYRLIEAIRQLCQGQPKPLPKAVESEVTSLLAELRVERMNKTFSLILNSVNVEYLKKLREQPDVVATLDANTIAFLGMLEPLLSSVSDMHVHTDVFFSTVKEIIEPDDREVQTETSLNKWLKTLNSVIKPRLQSKVRKHFGDSCRREKMAVARVIEHMNDLPLGLGADQMGADEPDKTELMKPTTDYLSDILKFKEQLESKSGKLSKAKVLYKLYKHMGSKHKSLTELSAAVENPADLFQHVAREEMIYSTIDMLDTLEGGLEALMPASEELIESKKLQEKRKGLFAKYHKLTKLELEIADDTERLQNEVLDFKDESDKYSRLATSKENTLSSAKPSKDIRKAKAQLDKLLSYQKKLDVDIGIIETVESDLASQSMDAPLPAQKRGFLKRMFGSKKTVQLDDRLKKLAKKKRYQGAHINLSDKNLTNETLLTQLKMYCQQQQQNLPAQKGQLEQVIASGSQQHQEKMQQVEQLIQQAGQDLSWLDKGADVAQIFQSQLSALNHKEYEKLAILQLKQMKANALKEQSQSRLDQCLNKYYEAADAFNTEKYNLYIETRKLLKQVGDIPLDTLGNHHELVFVNFIRKTASAISGLGKILDVAKVFTDKFDKSSETFKSLEALDAQEELEPLDSVEPTTMQNIIMRSVGAGAQAYCQKVLRPKCYYMNAWIKKLPAALAYEAEHPKAQTSDELRIQLNEVRQANPGVWAKIKQFFNWLGEKIGEGLNKLRGNGSKVVNDVMEHASSKKGMVVQYGLVVQEQAAVEPGLDEPGSKQSLKV